MKSLLSRRRREPKAVKQWRAILMVARGQMEMLTSRICAELRDGGCATSYEIAVYLEANPKDCAGALSNLRKSGHVKAVGTKPVGKRNTPSNLYEFVRMPEDCRFQARCTNRASRRKLLAESDAAEAEIQRLRG